MKKRMIIVFIICVVLSLTVYFIIDTIMPYLVSTMQVFAVVTIAYTAISVFTSCFLVMHESIKTKSRLFKLLYFVLSMLVYVLASWILLFILTYIIGFFAFIIFGVVLM